MQTYLKAIYGGAAAGLAVLSVALADNTLTWDEGVKVAIAVVGAFGVVWGVPNKQP